MTIAALCGVIAVKLLLPTSTETTKSCRSGLFSSYDTSADYLFKELGWKNLECQRQKIGEAVMVYKSLNGLVPDHLRSRLVDLSSVTNYQLRNTEASLAIPMPRTNFLENSFSYSGAVLWTSFPVRLRQAKTLSEFRSCCSSFLS